MYSRTRDRCLDLLFVHQEPVENVEVGSISAHLTVLPFLNGNTSDSS